MILSAMAGKTGFVQMVIGKLKLLQKGKNFFKTLMGNLIV
ncbi:uncharacterized protein METZ01_LOCUS86640 [marine metagenome]|uniref:Uncharacterized protein n=1 Tax=marine metagenome TaxID=408172 RepID=A0A381V074_9ZZZZ